MSRKNKKQKGERKLVNPKQGIVSKSEFQEARKEAIKRSKNHNREERLIRINASTLIGVPMNATKEYIENRVLKFKQRIGLVRVEG